MFWSLYRSLGLVCAIFILASQCEAGNKTASSDISDNLAEFLCLASLKGKNKIQIEGGNRHVKFIQARFIPIDIPALNNNPAIFIEEIVFGDLYRQNVLELTEDSLGMITGAIFNITKGDDSEPGTFNVQQLQNLTRGDLQGLPDCKAIFKGESTGVMKGTFPDCRHDKVDGKYAVYQFIFTCESVMILAPKTSYEAAPEFYEFKKEGKRYPVPRARRGFLCPCDKN